MSVRYTAEATMDGPAVRDLQRDIESDVASDVARWKDKIEVRLDNRQVFFLFFGSALVACMLFVLGVLVGKRIESRGRADAPVIEDPLAVLDRFRTQPPAGVDDALTFPRNLIVGPAGTAAKARSATAMTSAAMREDRSALREPRMAAKSVLTTAAALPGGPSFQPPAAPAGKPLASKPLARGTSSSPLLAHAGSMKGLPATSGTSAATGSPEGAAVTTAASTKPAAPAATRPATAQAGSVATLDAPSERARGHFLLQLSSFQDRVEAEAFAHRFPGKNAYVVATDLPGKGTWYRVRVGSFSTLQEASSAKAAFEREHNVIAYVAGSGPAR